ncbi:MAG: hypothetical protein HKN76_20135 [Saprospiraceae bacterium]|nr:hypothetical protein [Saprospiraceae bacterium]
MENYKITNKASWRRAGNNDLIELKPPKGINPLFYRKKDLHMLALTIADGGCIHISGGSGTGKTSLLFALTEVQQNWVRLCIYNNLEEKPLKMFRLAAFNFDSPGEMWYRRAINADGTYDEKQNLVEFMEDAIANPDDAYYAVHIMELGRTKPSIQHALVHLLHDGEIVDPLTGNSIGSGENIAFIADSNYAAADKHTFLLAEQDTALFNRINQTGIIIDHLSQQEETKILMSIRRALNVDNVPDALVEQIAQLGHLMRVEQNENGALSSVNPVSMRSYISFLKKASKSDLPPEDLADMTLFALASAEDRGVINELKSIVFGIQKYRYEMDEFSEMAF